MLIYKVDIGLDRGARKFFVAHSDVSGLHAEAATLQELIDVIRDLAPSLVESNHVPFQTQVMAFLRGLFSPTAGDDVATGGFNLRLSHDLRTAQ
jgi:hypothetical protein